MLGPILAITRSVFQAVQYMERKRLVEEFSPIFVQTTTRIFLFIVSILGLIFLNLTIKNDLFWVYSFISAFIAVIGTTMTTKALKKGDLSIIGPLMVLMPILTTISGIFLVNEIPSALGVLGIIVIAIGGYISHLDTHNLKNSQPFKKIIHNPNIQLAVSAIVLLSIGNGFQKLAINNSDIVTNIIAFGIFYFSISLVIMLNFNKNAKQDINTVLKHPKHPIIGGIAQTVSTVLAQATFGLMNIGYATSLFRTSMIFQVYLGGKYFKEKNMKQRIIGTIIILMGAVMIVFA